MSQGLIKTSKPAASQSYIVDYQNGKLLIVKDSWVQQNGLEKIFPRPGNIYWSKMEGFIDDFNKEFTANKSDNFTQLKNSFQERGIPFGVNDRFLDLETLWKHGWVAVYAHYFSTVSNSGTNNVYNDDNQSTTSDGNHSVKKRIRIIVEPICIAADDQELAKDTPQNRVAYMLQGALEIQNENVLETFSGDDLIGSAQILIDCISDNDPQCIGFALLGLAFTRCSWGGFKDIANLIEDVTAAAYYCKNAASIVSLIDNVANGTKDVGLDNILGFLSHLYSALASNNHTNTESSKPIDISAMTSTQKVKMGMAAAFKKLPWKIAQDLIDQLTPENIAVMAAFAEAGLLIMGGEAIAFASAVMLGYDLIKSLREMHESTQKMAKAKNQEQLDAATNQMADAMASASESGLAALFSTKIGKKPSKHGKDLPEEKETKQENPKDQGQKSEEDTNETDSKPDQSNQEPTPETPDQKPSNQEEPNPETKNNNQTPDDNNQKENQKDSKESTVEKPKEKPLSDEEFGEFRTQGYSKFLSRFRMYFTNSGRNFLKTLKKERQNMNPEQKLDRHANLKEAIGIANSGKEFFKKIDSFSGDLVKIQPPKYSKLTPTTIYFTTEEELSKAAEIARTGGPSIAEQFALPLESEREEYRVIKITTKPGIKTTIYVSTIAPASQENKSIGKMIKRPGGARQYLVIKRSDFTETGTIGMLKNNGQYKEGNFK